MAMLNKAKHLMPLAAVVASIMVLSSCSELVQSLKQMQEDDRQSRTAQLMRIADSTAQGGDLESALALYLRAGNMAPDELPPLLAAGQTAYRLGRYDQAARSFERATVIDPGSIGSHTGYGKTLIAQGHASEAQRQFLKVIELAPADYHGHNGLGVALDMSGQHSQAQEHYRIGLATAPKTISLINNLALSLAMGDQFEQALAVLDPYSNDPRAGALLRQNLALIYGLAGQTDKAAAMAARDLDENSVVNNLKYYQRLRTLSQSERAKALLAASR